MSIIGKSKENKKLLNQIDELKKKNKSLLEKIQKTDLDSQSPILNSAEKEDSVESFFKMLSAGYFLYETADRIIHPSKSLFELLESCISDDYITPDSFLEIVHPGDKEFIIELFDHPKSNKKTIAGQFRVFQKKDARDIKIFSVNGYYIPKDEDNLILNCILRDITKEVKQNKDNQRAFERASEADRIKTVFLLNISHNIRTPMNSILGFAELLSISDPPKTRRKEFIKVIKKQSKKLLQFIDDIAEIAKYESGTMQVTKVPVNLNLLINEIKLEIDSYRSEKSREQMEIIQDLPVAEGIEIYSDAGRLHQIFLNLIEHSLKNTSTGTITVGYKPPSDNRIEMFVSDTSKNISKEEIKDIFERYAQIDKNDFSRYEDITGLGLTIAKSVVKLLGGRISAELKPDSGVLFTFSIPYEIPSKPETESVEKEISLGLKYKWQNKLILIVEDEEVNGLFLEAIFHETGAKTLYAKNGKQAIELCKSISKINLILMDIRMPVMNGIDATKEIRKFNDSIPVIAQTALATEEDINLCLQAGCDAVVTKPIEVEELLRSVNLYISRH